MKEMTLAKAIDLASDEGKRLRKCTKKPDTWVVQAVDLDYCIYGVRVGNTVRVYVAEYDGERIEKKMVHKVLLAEDGITWLKSVKPFMA